MNFSAIKSIACIGEVMIELVPSDKADASARIGVAGDTYNSAVYLRREIDGRGIDVAYVTALGSDPYSARIRRAIESHGLNASYIETRHDAGPGLYAIDTDAHGERSFTYWRSASAARTMFASPCEVDLSRLQEFGLIALSGITIAILPANTRKELMTALDHYRSNGGLVAYDSNYRPRLWESAEVAQQVNMDMWARTDIALPSLDDEMDLFGDQSQEAVLARLTNAGVRFGALKRGALGPLNIAEPDLGKAYAPASHVVDTTAAGDSFNAGFLGGLCKGFDVDEAMQNAHDLSCRVIAQKGAIIPI